MTISLTAGAHTSANVNLNAAKSLTVLVVEKNDWLGSAKIMSQIVEQSPTADVELLIVIDATSATSDEANLGSYLDERGLSSVRVTRCPGAGLANGWNYGASASRTPYLVRLDAHGDLPGDFLRGALEALSTYSGDDGDLILGGPVSLIVDPGNAGDIVAEVIASLETTPLFSGGMGPHKKELAEPTIASFSARAVYPTALIRQMGGFRALPFACEDTDFAERVVRSGYRFVLLPQLLTYHYTRSTLSGFARQKVRNGAAISFLFTTGSRPQVRKLAPALAGVGWIACVAASRRSRAWAAGGAAVYTVAAAGLSARGIRRSPLSPSRRALAVALAPLVASIGHVAYAIGEVRGVATALRDLLSFRSARGSVGHAVGLTKAAAADDEDACLA